MSPSKLRLRRHRLLAKRPTVVFSLLLLVTSASAPAGSSTIPELDSYFQRREPFYGAVLVRRGDDILLRKAYGLADAELGVPLLPEHVFRIGSVTKPFTAQAILLLASRGELRLEDSICDFLGPCPAAWKPVTIHHLLGHSSGIPDLFGTLEAVPVEETRQEVVRVLEELESPPLEAPPGSTYAYSNFNYVLLGLVVEQVSGQRWGEFLEERLFRPLGMKNTRYDDVWAIVPGRVRGYTLRDGELANAELDDHAAYAAGGLHSTLDDLDRWLSALTEGRILPQEWQQKAHTPGLGEYGYGWKVEKQFRHLSYHHTGGVDGFSSHVVEYPADGLRIVLLSNFEEARPRGTACDLAAIVFGADHHLLTTESVRLPSSRLEELSGSYLPEDGEVLHLEREGTGLRYRRGEVSFRLLPTAASRFVVEQAPELWMRIEETASGRELIAERCGEVVLRAISTN